MSEQVVRSAVSPWWAQYEAWLATEREGVIPFTPSDERFVAAMIAWLDDCQRDKHKAS